MIVRFIKMDYSTGALWKRKYLDKKEAHKVRISQLILLTLLVSCAGQGPVQTALHSNHVSYQLVDDSVSDQTTSSVIWGVWEGTISEDRSIVEIVPDRHAAVTNQFNVLCFLEQDPCIDCVKVISKEIIGANRLDVVVQIRHPFPGHKELTGFDVFGGIQFRGSYMISYDNSSGSCFNQRIPWRYNDEPQMLNFDGLGLGFLYTPWDNDKPLSHFQDGKLGGERIWFPEYGDDAQLYWGYKLYRTNEERNMFESNGVASRKYELWLPEGKIKFGYVVIAHWWPPDVIPVQNPVSDFSIGANRMGPSRFELLNVSGFLSADQPVSVLIRAYWTKTGLHDDEKVEVECSLPSCLECVSYGVAMFDEQEVVEEGEGYSDILVTLVRWPEGPDRCEPGVYPVLLNFRHFNCGVGQYSVHATHYTFDVICAD